MELSGNGGIVYNPLLRDKVRNRNRKAPLKSHPDLHTSAASLYSSPIHRVAAGSSITKIASKGKKPFGPFSLDKKQHRSDNSTCLSSSAAGKFEAAGKEGEWRDEVNTAF